MYNPNEISNAIKNSAKNKSITMKQLLEECGINKGFIYDLEHKKSYPSCDKISRIADHLDCSVDYLLGRTDNPKVNKQDIAFIYDIQKTRELILNLLKKNAKTTNQMLASLGYNNSLILDMARKNSMPSGDKLGKIADYLDCSVDYLLGRTDNPEVNK